MGGYFSKTFNPATDISNLSKRVFIVTGGNAGIGYATVQHLARHGAKVYLAARNEKKALAAIQQIRQEGLNPGNGEVVYLPLDLSDVRNAKKAAQDFVEKETRLDVLINNAGQMIVPSARSKHDLQDIMVVNHFSLFVFTTTLLPLLKKTAKEPNSDVRIVNVASEGMGSVKDIRFRNKDDFNDEHASALWPAFARYGRSKAANMLFTKELQRRLDAEGVPILAMAIHPGNVDSEGIQSIVANSPFVLKPLLHLLRGALFVAPEKGAYASVFAAAAPVVRAESQKYKAAYIAGPTATITPPHFKDADDPMLAKELWETTESILKDIGV
ncbi:unnamed protein product [Somion occarium]|uniref:NAD-P-binding protein n=1 Tax=Somion occarium TaxID=3059160 RepID=A0ABP1D4X0_9APHY